MRRILAAVATTAISLALTISATAAPAPTAAVGAHDDRITGHRYVRHDGGTDDAIELCNSQKPKDFGNRTQNNEPFSVVDPGNPDLVLAGWNDYCSGWMGLGFSTD